VRRIRPSKPASRSPISKVTTYLWNQDLISRLHTTLYPLALLIQAPRAHRQNFRLVQFLHAGLGEENATCRFGLGFYALDEHAVEERREGLDGFESGRLFVCEYLETVAIVQMEKIAYLRLGEVDNAAELT
jgi:hypothetical protein